MFELKYKLANDTKEVDLGIEFLYIFNKNILMNYFWKSIAQHVLFQKK